MGIRKPQVIKSSKVFDEVFSEGKKLYSEHLMLVTRPSAAGRVGFAVSKRVKGAVPRNRAKRWLREIVRINKHVLPTKFDVVCIAKQGVECTKFDTLNEEYLHLVGQLRNVSNRRQ